MEVLEEVGTELAVTFESSSVYDIYACEDPRLCRSLFPCPDIAMVLDDQQVRLSVYQYDLSMFILISHWYSPPDGSRPVRPRYSLHRCTYCRKTLLHNVQPTKT